MFYNNIWHVKSVLNIQYKQPQLNKKKHVKSALNRQCKQTHQNKKTHVISNKQTWEIYL